MRPFLRPLDDSLVLFGRVRTGLYANSYHVDLSKNPYAVEIALVDDLQTGDVPVLACGGATRAKKRLFVSSSGRPSELINHFGAPVSASG
jgi:hypothetical protein